MLKMRKQPVAVFSPRDIYRLPGDRVYQLDHTLDHKTVMLDLYDSNGWRKSTAGDLSYRTVKKNGVPRSAIEIDGVWYW